MILIHYIYTQVKTFRTLTACYTNIIPNSIKNKKIACQETDDFEVGSGFEPLYKLLQSSA